LRVARRFGAASDEPSVEASPAGSAAVEAFARVDVRRFGAGASVADSEATLASVVAFALVDVRRFGAAGAVPAASSAADVSVLTAVAAAPAGFRRVVARRLGASAADATPASPDVTSDAEDSA
jgi:hypothetical protein